MPQLNVLYMVCLPGCSIVSSLHINGRQGGECWVVWSHLAAAGSFYTKQHGGGCVCVSVCTCEDILAGPHDFKGLFEGSDLVLGSCFGHLVAMVLVSSYGTHYVSEGPQTDGSTSVCVFVVCLSAHPGVPLQAPPSPCDWSQQCSLSLQAWRSETCRRVQGPFGSFSLRLANLLGSRCTGSGSLTPFQREDVAFATEKKFFKGRNFFL